MPKSQRVVLSARTRTARVAVGAHSQLLRAGSALRTIMLRGSGGGVEGRGDGTGAGACEVWSRSVSWHAPRRLGIFLRAQWLPSWPKQVNMPLYQRAPIPFLRTPSSISMDGPSLRAQHGMLNTKSNQFGKQV